MTRDIRATYLIFPAWTQNFWTWVTGKALPGQEPLFVHSWWSYTLATFATFFGGIALSATAASLRFDFWGVAVVAGWLLTVCGARTLFLVILHQCVHRRLSGDRLIDETIGDIASIVVLNQNQRDFREDHFATHHRRATFATVADWPVRLLDSLGLRAGMSKRKIWIRAVLALVSPHFHVPAFIRRIRSNLVYQGPRRFAVLVTFVAAMAALHAGLPNGLVVMALAYWIPMTVFYQASALLDNLGEHGWLVPADPAHPARHYHANRTWARFTGAPVPDPGLPWYRAVPAWAKWAALMAFYHVPTRMLVVVGDLPNHDFHHRYPVSGSWTVAAYARQRDIDDGHPGWPPYIEFWGQIAAMDHVFAGLAAAPPEAAPSYRGAPAVAAE
ncbi:MAG: hypothetical protein RID91_03885 [Azospirillaceae bacterium]